VLYDAATSWYRLTLSVPMVCVQFLDLCDWELQNRQILAEPDEAMDVPRKEPAFGLAKVVLSTHHDHAGGDLCTD
jgi:hypothetical protein